MWQNAGVCEEISAAVRLLANVCTGNSLFYTAPYSDSGQDAGFMGRGHLQSSSEPNIYYAGWELAVDLSLNIAVHCRLDSAPVLVLRVTTIIYRRFNYVYTYSYHPRIVYTGKHPRELKYLYFLNMYTTYNMKL